MAMRSLTPTRPLGSWAWSYKLNQLAKENVPLDRILPEIKKSMEKLSKTQEEIGPPFSYAFITEEGFRRID